MADLTLSELRYRLGSIAADPTVGRMLAELLVSLPSALNLVPNRPEAAEENAGLLAEALSLQKNVILGPGQFYVNPIIVEHRACFSLRGAGIGRSGQNPNPSLATVLIAASDGADDAIFTNEPTTYVNFARNSMIDGIVFAGYGQAGDTFGAVNPDPDEMLGVGIALYCGEKTTIHNCSFQGLKTGLLLTDPGGGVEARSWGYRVVACNATSCHNAYQLIGNDNNVGHTAFRDCTAELCHRGFYINETAATGNVLDNCLAEGYPDTADHYGLRMVGTTVQATNLYLEGTDSPGRTNPDLIAETATFAKIRGHRIGDYNVASGCSVGVSDMRTVDPTPAHTLDDTSFLLTNTSGTW